MHGNVWEHIVSLDYRTARWIFTKLGRDEVFMVAHMGKDVLAISTQGRIQGRAKKGHGRGVIFLKKFFFRPEGYSHKPNTEQ